MKNKDKRALMLWLGTSATLAEVEGFETIGLAGNERFSEAARRAFRLLWLWSAVRVGSPEQDSFYAKCGKAMFDRRIWRARQWIRRFQDAGL